MDIHDGSQSFRGKKHRLPTEMYKHRGAYFITICTDQKKHLFGHIDNSVMNHSPLGLIAEQRLVSLPEHHPSLDVGDYAIMPNHLHALFHLRVDSDSGESIINVVNQFKSSVTRHARQQNILGADSLWQPGFWDHIVRGADDYQRIQEYTLNNTNVWHLDSENRNRSGNHSIYAYLERFQGNPPKVRFLPKRT